MYPVFGPPHTRQLRLLILCAATCEPPPTVGLRVWNFLLPSPFTELPSQCSPAAPGLPCRLAVRPLPGRRSRTERGPREKQSVSLAALAPAAWSAAVPWGSVVCPLEKAGWAQSRCAGRCGLGPSWISLDGPTADGPGSQARLLTGRP